MHVNWTMPLNGALRGTLPNPSILLEDASLVLSARSFGFRALPGSAQWTAPIDTAARARTFTVFLF